MTAGLHPSLTLSRRRRTSALFSSADMVHAPDDSIVNGRGMCAERSVSAAAEGHRLHAVVRQSRFHLYRLLVIRRGLGRHRVDAHRRSAATQSLKAEVVEREATEIRKPLQCVARDEELALEVSRRLFDA